MLHSWGANNISQPLFPASIPFCTFFQAMQHLLRTDKTFVAKLHQAYIDSLNNKLNWRHHSIFTMIFCHVCCDTELRFLRKELQILNRHLRAHHTQTTTGEIFFDLLQKYRYIFRQPVSIFDSFRFKIDPSMWKQPTYFIEISRSIYIFMKNVTLLTRQYFEPRLRDKNIFCHDNPARHGLEVLYPLRILNQTATMDTGSVSGTEFLIHIWLV